MAFLEAMHRLWPEVAAAAPARVLQAMTYVYRLHVTYPPRSQEWGWEPPGWEPEGMLSSESADDGYFRWPANRMCLTIGTAKRRAELFLKYGAEVEIERSEPVAWPTVKRDAEKLAALVSSVPVEETTP